MAALGSSGTYVVIDDPQAYIIVTAYANFLAWGGGGGGGIDARLVEEPKPQLAFERKPSHKLSPLERAQQSRAAKGDLLKRMRR